MDGHLTPKAVLSAAVFVTSLLVSGGVWINSVVSDLELLIVEEVGSFDDRNAAMFKTLDERNTAMFKELDDRNIAAFKSLEDRLVDKFEILAESTKSASDDLNYRLGLHQGLTATKESTP